MTIKELYEYGKNHNCLESEILVENEYELYQSSIKRPTNIELTDIVEEKEFDNPIILYIAKKQGEE